MLTEDCWAGEGAAKCAECGATLELVRLGKHQHPTCSQHPVAMWPISEAQYQEALTAYEDAYEFTDSHCHGISAVIKTILKWRDDPEAERRRTLGIMPPHKLPAVVRTIDRKRFESAPCYLCGYNGEGYFQPTTHPCAKEYHGHVGGFTEDRDDG